jgi:hypothetical protein
VFVVELEVDGFRMLVAVKGDGLGGRYPSGWVMALQLCAILEIIGLLVVQPFKLVPLWIVDISAQLLFR